MSSESSNFLRSILHADSEKGTYGGQVVTRFPPEPNGYLHIGHAKAICVDFGLAEEFGGRCHLRMDDTNPAKEEMEYVRAIQEDVRWLGFDWGEHFYQASDYFEEMYQFAEWLVEQGEAYVCFLSEEETRDYRGTVTEPGRPSPTRDTSAQENLTLLRGMRHGEFDDGHCLLRARIDMSAANMKLRDPPLYRIRHTSHQHTGDAWCIYPLYDYAHPLGDAIEGITHSICTLEFENNRDIYDWVVERYVRWKGGQQVPPRQYEMARLNLAYTVMSKRRLLRLVQGGHVSGWDDPRMPTIAGLRRRGVTPEAIRDFCERIGVAKADSLVDLELFEFSIRNDLNTRAPRRMAVLDPLPVTLTSWPSGTVDQLEIPDWPHDVPKEGTRTVPFTGALAIERSDFAEEPPKGWKRLSPGAEVRLRHGYIIRCEEVLRDADGEVVGLRCSHDPDSRGGNATDGRKVKGTIHWVDRTHGVPAEVRLYSPLFDVERPDAIDGDFLDHIDADSREVRTAIVEPSVANAPVGTHLQFERQGYFVVDQDSGERRVFNRTVGLRDRYTRKAEPARDKKKAPVHDGTREWTPEELALTAPWEARGVDRQDAILLATEPEIARLFEEAVALGADARATSKFLIAEVRTGEGVVLPRQLVALVRMQSEGTVNARQARALLAEVRGTDQDPAAIATAQGMTQVNDTDALRAHVEQVVAENPEEVARFRDNPRLIGFFVGQVMKRTGGRANPKLVRQLLGEALGA